MSLLDHLRNLCKVGGDQVTRTIHMMIFLIRSIQIRKVGATSQINSKSALYRGLPS